MATERQTALITLNPQPQKPVPPEGVRYSGRDFSPQEIRYMRRLISGDPTLCRAELSRRVCDDLEWLRPDGRRKDMSCRVAMLAMHRDGLIQLPEPRHKNVNGNRQPQITERSAPREPVEAPAGELGKLQYEPISAGNRSGLWNELIERYHYLGYNPLPGAQMRYLVHSGPQHGGELLAALGFGAAAWKVAPRDDYIGWTHPQRKANLPLITNNARFLILPWVRSHNLASRILSTVARRLPSDWQERYGQEPVLLETFVEKQRFEGTCYKAANWVEVGETKGRGKLDSEHKNAVPIKKIFLYPLTQDFRQTLCSD